MKNLLPLMLLAFLILGVFAVQAQAHKLQPAYLEISEQGNGTFNVLWKRPLVGNQPMDIYPLFPQSCRNLTEPVLRPSDVAIERWMINCGESGLANQTLVIDGLVNTVTDTLMRVDLADGSIHTSVLRPDAPEWRIPEQPSKLEVAKSYLGLGVEHILGGFDHLLFVLGLLLIVCSTKLLITTITAFTLAHSVTLTMAALGFVHVPQTPVEAVIALSILFLATELAKQHRGEQGLTSRAPWLVALSFGLLHGFGFAGALSEIGLPQTEIPLSLLFFNIGVEVGQIMFVVVVLFVQMFIRRVGFKWPSWAEQMPAYGIGSLAAFWFIQRTLTF
jgi:hydrogenase/urease accessory protein HupE